MPLVSKSGKVVAYNEELFFIKSKDLLITWLRYKGHVTNLANC